LSQADIVNGLRQLLQAFAQDEKPKPVVVVIDELDKISQTSDLIDTINDLKDLFHIDGVHFVVSVSTDALLSFEQRGLVTRDAFDSSFDTIVPVQALSLDESLRVISARAEGFPPIVGAFCHAWSGGLPRELLRVARRCVEIQRSANEAQSVELFVRVVVAEDVVSVIEATMRAAARDASERSSLMRLRDRGRSLREGQISSADMPESDAAIGSIASVVALGEALYAYFATASDAHVGLSQWLTPTAVRKAIEAAAHAMSVRGETDEIRAEAFEMAISSLLDPTVSTLA